MSRSKQKGTSGENEAQRWWSRWFAWVERRALRGIRDTGDLTLPFPVSVKRCETWPIHKWLTELAKMEENAQASGLIMARRNREPWVFIVPERTMRQFMDAIHGAPETLVELTPKGVQVATEQATR